MISPKIQKSLNQQVQLEAESSQIYLAMASWAEVEGYNGISDFLFKHSDEERIHMLKLLKFINERGGHGIVPALPQPAQKYKGIRTLFEQVLNHEIHVSTEINKLVDICLEEKDYTTHNFLQWYVSEQIEEEALARRVIDKLKLIGDDKGGLYLLDRDIVTIEGTLKTEKGGRG
ncbi:ferritin [Agriterribacter sp.]|uniref:ferritin n=1 Tax=Agriterribacter sp. TaxID=2821509 RepID=UPI002C06B65B|nr:ferritin [Agriterribacter sp.]HRP57485.1 ferritin [Agriterribacter sp.]